MRRNYRFLSPETDPADGGAAATPADLTAVPEGEAPPNEGEDLIAGFDAALAKAEGKPVEPAPTEPEPEAKAEDAPTDPVEPAPEEDPVDTEIAALGLKEKSAARFRELTSEIKEAAPWRDALKEAGVEKIEDIPRIVQRAKDADDLISMVADTGASPDQYGMALDYLRLVNAGTKGDLKAAEQAYDVMAKELSALAQLLGKEVPGVHDPLAAHQDLLAEIESGDLTRTRALEIAATRTHRAVRDSNDQRMAEQAAQQQAIDHGRQGLIAFDQHMTANDPTYAAKRPILDGIVEVIRQTLPPQKWLAATQQAYARINLPAPAAAPAASRPSPGPMRSTGPVRASAPAASMAPTTFDDPMAALEFGLGRAK